MLVDRIRRAYEEIAKVERIAAQFPKDIYVQANLDSLRYDAAELENEWAAETRQAQQEVCRYRMIPARANFFSIRAVTQSLLEFQELFSQIYDAVKNGAKKQARLAADILDQTNFNLAFTYPGSLGVAMSVDSRADLFTGEFDASIDTLMQISQVEDEHDIRDLAKALGNAVVKRTYEWAQANSAFSYSVDVDWTTLSGVHKGGMIDLTAFNRLVTLIGRASDSEKKDINVRGVLVGLDSKTRRFRFVDPLGDDYAGPMAESFPAGAVWLVNEAYVADIEVEETLEYATETTKQIFRLKHLELVPKELPLS